MVGADVGKNEVGVEMGNSVGLWDEGGGDEVKGERLGECDDSG